MQNGSNWFKSSCHKVALEFFAINTPNPPHWTLNSCFHAFCTIWLHLGLFACLPILSAKHVKLVQNFVPRSCVGIFPTNAPDPPHWTLNSCSGAFHTNLVHLGLFGWITKTRCKTGLQVQKFVLPSRVGILRNERTQSSELDSKLLFLCVLFYLGAFGTVWLPYSVQNGQNWCKSSCHEVASEFFATNAPIQPIGA